MGRRRPANAVSNAPEREAARAAPEVIPQEAEGAAEVWTSPAARRRQALAVGLGAGLMGLGVVAPWRQGTLAAAVWAPEALGASAPGALGLAAAVSFGAALLAGVSAAAGRAAPRRLRLAAGAAAVGAVQCLFGVPQAGLATPFDATRSGLGGVSLWSLALVAGSACAAAGQVPTNTRSRGVAAVGAAVIGGIALAPAWPGAEWRVPLAAAFGGGTAAAVVAAWVAAAVGSTAWAAGRVRTPRWGWSTAAALWAGAPTVAAAASGAWAAGLIAGGAAVVALATLPTALAAPGDEMGDRRAERGAELVVLGLIWGAWALLKTHGLAASNTDENIYFYDAWLWAQGEWPYRDFFFAHPPLHLLPLALLFAIFGFQLTLAKLLAPMAASFAGLFVHRLVRGSFGRWPAALALVGFLFASEVLKASTNLTGVNITLAFIAAGTWAFVAHRFAASGVLFGLAASTGFYAMAGFLALLAIAAVARWREALRMALGFAAVFGAISLLFASIGGDAYVEGVYQYHGLKPVKLEGRQELLGPDGRGLGAIVHNFTNVFLSSERFLGNVYYHGTLWWGALWSLLPLGLGPWLRREPGGWTWRVLDPRRLLDSSPESTGRILWLVALAYFVELSMLRELHDHYFVLPFAALAPLWAYTWMRIVELGVSALRRRWAGLAWGREVVGVVVLAGLLATTGFVRAWANAKAWPEERERAGEVVPFAYEEPPVLQELSGLAYLLFWRESRVRGQLQPGYAHYLWSKKRWFSAAAEMAERVRATTPEDATILGASTVAPLVALLAGRRIAANEVDTNTKRFRSGLLEPRELFDRACATKLAYLVAGPNAFFTPQSTPRLPVFRGQFALDATYEDPHVKHFGAATFVLYRRIGDLEADPPVCRWP